MLAYERQRGDTIIEVLFAFTVFSLLAVGASIVMNQGIAAAQKSLEITLVRQQIDAQAEAIRYIRDTYIDSLTGTHGSYTNDAVNDWKAMTVFGSGKLVRSATDFGIVGGRCPDITAIANRFVLDAHNGTLGHYKPEKLEAGGLPYSQIDYSGSVTPGEVKGYGLWVEAVRNDDSKKYVDFHIRACWDSPGDGPSSSLGTIVRLYAP